MFFDSGILSEAPDLLSTDRLLLTVIEGVPALMVNEGINALLWPIISTEPWDSPRGVEVWDELEREMHASPAEHRGQVDVVAARRSPRAGSSARVGDPSTVSSIFPRGGKMK